MALSEIKRYVQCQWPAECLHLNLKETVTVRHCSVVSGANAGVNHIAEFNRDLACSSYLTKITANHDVNEESKVSL